MDSDLTFEEKQKIYAEDSRSPCKYQTNCYQKNPDHHTKFKHPPKKEECTVGVKRKSKDSDHDAVENVKQKCVKTDVETKKEETGSDNDKESKKADETTGGEENHASDVLKMCHLKMPDDFFKLYAFCKNLKNSDPARALSAVGLTLVGPYDILNNKHSKETLEKCNFATHWRYFYDPPEFQTVLQGPEAEGLHFGYWRDLPTEVPSIVVSNKAKIDCKIQAIADNIFGAIEKYLEQKIKESNPFEKTTTSNVLSKLKAFAKKEDIPLGKEQAIIKAREKKVVAKTFHGLGVVVPYNKKTQLGYRELSVSNNELQKILKNLQNAETDEDKKISKSRLGEIIRLATIAGDECDFGTCLELGHDLFSSGVIELHSAVLGMLKLAYSELDRGQFLKIIEAHLEDRKKECDGKNLSKIQ